ncbi:MAG: hypothetical protein OXG04_06160 [Acidobacteria bacterium]|nr:hypothetical protein [Acidobacteriota bacterium]
MLSLDAGRVVTFDTLLRRVWANRENADANPGAHLRQETCGASSATARDSPAYIFNRRGVGYRMAKPADPYGRDGGDARVRPDLIRLRLRPPAPSSRCLVQRGSASFTGARPTAGKNPPRLRESARIRTTEEKAGGTTMGQAER